MKHLLWIAPLISALLILDKVNNILTLLELQRTLIQVGEPMDDSIFRGALSGDIIAIVFIGFLLFLFLKITSNSNKDSK